jgi:hypothetical protein
MDEEINHLRDAPELKKSRNCRPFCLGNHFMRTSVECHGENINAKDPVREHLTARKTWTKDPAMMVGGLRA